MLRIAAYCFPCDAVFAALHANVFTHQRRRIRKNAAARVRKRQNGTSPLCMPPAAARASSMARNALQRSVLRSLQLRACVPARTAASAGIST